MNTPSPLQPMGRLPQTGSGRSGLNLAIITIVALHAVFFSGLLLQGCRPRRTETVSTPSPDLGLAPSPATNATSPDPFAGFAPPYTPPTAATPGATSPPPEEPEATPSTPPATTPTNLWTGITSPPAAQPFQPEPLLTPAPAPATEHTIVPGDTPSKIARQYGITLDQLREANPTMEDRRLQVGQRLIIPAPARRETAAAAPEAEAGERIYVVKPGDTLTRIAARHGTTVKELRAYNNLRTDRILVNQKLKLPPTAAAPAPAPPQP